MKIKSNKKTPRYAALMVTSFGCMQCSTTGSDEENKKSKTKGEENSRCPN